MLENRRGEPLDTTLTFELVTAFNQPIGGWNVASVTNMYGQLSKCLGSSAASPQPLTVYLQPEEEGDLDSKVDSSVADTEASQASTLLTCLLLACQAFTLSSRHWRHPRRLVGIASESRGMVHIPFLGTPTHCRLPAAPLPTARRVGCAYRRRRLGLHRGCTDGTGFRLPLEP